MRIGPVLRGWRMHREISLRNLAKEIGISASTLSRLETGENVDAQSLSKILIFLISNETQEKAA